MEKNILEQHIIDMIKTFPVWMKCNVVLNQIHSFSDRYLSEEIDSMLDWSKINDLFSVPAVKYDYNIFDEINSVEELERIREESIMGDILETPYYRQKCTKCGEIFTLTKKEIDWFVGKELNVPKKCYYCRKGISKPSPIKETKKEVTEDIPVKSSMQLALEKAGLHI